MLIKISNSTMVNPERVDCVEINNSQLTIYVGGKKYIVTKDIENILKQLCQDDDTKQKWVG